MISPWTLFACFFDRTPEPAEAVLALDTYSSSSDDRAGSELTLNWVNAVLDSAMLLTESAEHPEKSQIHDVGDSLRPFMQNCQSIGTIRIDQQRQQQQ